MSPQQNIRFWLKNQRHIILGNISACHVIGIIVIPNELNLPIFTEYRYMWYFYHFTLLINPM